MENIILNNFRLFKNQTDFQLAPITVLTGRNNSGKSSIIKALLLFDDYLNSNDQFFLNFSGKNSIKHKINEFQNAINWNSNDESFSFGFIKEKALLNFHFINHNKYSAILKKVEYKVIDKNIYFTLSKVAESEDLFYDLEFNENTVEYFQKRTLRPRLEGQLRILKRKLQDANAPSEATTKTHTIQTIIDAALHDTKALISYKKSLESDIIDLEAELNDFNNNEGYQNSSPKFKVHIDYDEQREYSKSIAEVVGLGITGWVEKMNDEQKSNLEENELTKKLLLEHKYTQLKTRNQFDSSFVIVYYLKALMNFKIEHLSPNRTRQEKVYFKESRSTEIENEIAEYLKIKEFSKNNRNAVRSKDVMLFLEKWLKEFGLGEEIRVETVEGVLNKLSILSNGKKINLVDLGFGSGQILTILLKISNTINNLRVNRKSLIRGGIKNNYGLITIEEPESNLHPQFHSKMAELIVECYKEYKIQFIIETHSEYLVRKLQLLVADNNAPLNKDEVIIYYMDNSNSDTSIKKIFIGENGILTDKFGTGFFDEAANQAIDLMTIKNKIKKV